MLQLIEKEWLEEVMKKKILVGLSILACGFLLVSCGGSGDAAAPKGGTSPEGKEIPIETAAMALMKDTEEGKYSLVSTSELDNLLKEKKDSIVLIDTMPADKYAESHIDGALNAPLPKEMSELKDSEKAVLLALAEEHKDKTIILYCGFTSCTRSHVGAQILVENGFKDVVRYPGGIVAWNEK